MPHRRVIATEAHSRPNAVLFAEYDGIICGGMNRTNIVRAAAGKPVKVVNRTFNHICLVQRPKPRSFRRA